MSGYRSDVRTPFFRIREHWLGKCFALSPTLFSSLYGYSLHKQYVSYASLLVARMQATYFLLARKLVAQVKVMVTSLKENFQKLKFKPNIYKIQKLCNTVRIISLANGLESGRIDAF